MSALETLEKQIAELEAATAKLRISQRTRSKKLAAVKALIAAQEFSAFEILEVERFQKLLEVRQSIERHGFSPYELGLLSAKGSLGKHLASLPPLVENGGEL